MVKKIIVLVLLGVVLTGVGVLTTQHYHQNKQVKAKAVASDKATINTLEQQLAQERATSAKFAQAYQNERLQCEMGRGAYDKLPTYLTKVVAAPKCGKAVLQ